MHNSQNHLILKDWKKIKKIGLLRVKLKKKTKKKNIIPINNTLWVWL